MSSTTYIVDVVGELFAIEIEPEVQDWLEALPAKYFLEIDEYVGLLAEQAESLSEPYARYLGDGVRELRPTLGGAAIRITYWIAPGRRVILLTVFRKTRMREDAEVKSAKLTQQTCQAEHEPAHREFIRTIEKGELDR